MWRVSVQENETAVDVDSGDACTTLSMNLMPLNSMPYSGHKSKFCHVHFTTIF